MTPAQSNSIKENCVPISSNCIIWQGKPLPCINLCPGDSISEVVYKLACLVCRLQDQLDLSTLDLACLFNTCASCPNPDKTLKNVLQLLIDNACSANKGSINPASYQVGMIYDLTVDQIGAIINSGGTLSYV